METGFWNRLRAWRKLSSTAPVAEDDEVIGGRQAEQFLHTLVQSHYRFKRAALYPNKRVPAGNRRREIDLIVVTDRRIHLIEVKNWSGSLRIAGGRWVQTNRNGREIAHPDLVADHQDKADALVDHLRDQGVTLDRRTQAKYLSNKVVFMNPRLVVQDQAIANHPDVLLADRLNSYLDGQRRSGFGERVLGSVIQWCLDSESSSRVMDEAFGSLTPDVVAKVRDAVDRLSTWDSLAYYGSKIETGDLIHASIGGEVIRRDRIGGRSVCSVRWTRNTLWGLFKAVTGIGSLGRLRLPDGTRRLGTEDFVLFHRVGDREPSKILLRQLDRITLG